MKVLVHPQRVELYVRAYKVRPQNRQGPGAYILVEGMGIEPMSSGFSDQRSDLLSYPSKWPGWRDSNSQNFLVPNQEPYQIWPHPDIKIVAGVEPVYFPSKKNPFYYLVLNFYFGNGRTTYLSNPLSLQPLWGTSFHLTTLLFDKN